MKSSTYKKIILSVSSILFVFLLWQLLVVIKKDDFIFPNIFIILKRSGEILFSKDIVILLTTFLRILIVLVISFALAIIFAFIYVRLPLSINFLRPIITILKAAPFAIISVYIFFAFNKNVAPYIISFLVIFPIIMEGIIGSIDNIDSHIKDELSMLNISEFNKYIKIYIPMCAPSFRSILLQSFGLGLKCMIMAEYICQVDNSIGQVLVNVKYNMEFDLVLAWLVIVVLIVSLIDILIVRISKKYEYKV